jgi:nicotinate-nucleotide pyrophosphorylase (carboxylating)
MTVLAAPDLGLDAAEVERVIRTALAEDLKLGPDVTTNACVDADARGTALIRTRADGVVAGLPVARAVLESISGANTFSWRAVHTDGDKITAAETLCGVEAGLRGLLTAERTMLNLLTHLSGIATLTAKWVAAVEGTGARIRDTRKTTPGLRALEKYAVRCGGGVNHRMALGDVALIKDNHIAAAGSVANAVASVRAHAPDIELEVECDTVGQVEEAIAEGVRFILLDNMSMDQLRACVSVARIAPGVQLEASGGLTLANARSVAKTGVDYLAVGALTHSADALDIGLDLSSEAVTR